MDDDRATFGICLSINLLIEVASIVYLGVLCSAEGTVVGLTAMLVLGGIVTYNRLVNATVENILKELFSLAIENGNVVLAKEIRKNYINAVNKVPSIATQTVCWWLAPITVVADIVLYYNI